MKRLQGMMMKTFVLLIVFCLIDPLPTYGKYQMLQTIPLEFMEQDLQAKQDAEPENSQWVYRMGRMYYLAFAMGAGASFTYFPEKAGENFPEERTLDWKVAQIADQVSSTDQESFLLGNYPDDPHQWQVKVLTEAERMAYAEKAFGCLSAALEMSPKNGLYALTLASFQQRWLASDYPEIASMDGITVASTLALYQRAWKRLRKKDLALDYLPLSGQVYSAEAARGWLALAASSATEDRKTKRKMEKDIRKLSTLKIGMITPLIFELRHERRVPVDEQAAVRFDVVGDGRGGEWTWPRAGAAILVWDPEERGEIRSGVQLFGGYTWQMPWHHGFEPLALLDRNGDGQLTGHELKGVSAWFDREPLGVSATEEVIPLAQLGVTGLRVVSEPFPGKHAERWNEQGVEMADGSLYPLWDWLAEPK
ncbi:hypothetical protein P3T73_17705 [Kiritimatiellota bacterium B12222]|nr:hypothetical protein P3T73_17705 [Kiritimatiellota bacterium B12222]